MLSQLLQKVCSFSSILVVMLCSTDLYGGWESNGGDTNFDQDNIWFLTGHEVVEYCISRSSGNPIPFELASEIIERSFARWKTFVFLRSLGLPLGDLRKDDYLFLDRLPRAPSRNFVSTGPCHQRGDKRLEFHLGTKTPLIEQELNRRDHTALALVVRDSFDHQRYENSGAIYIKPTDNQLQFEMLVMHEIGHIFGIPHDQVYIMDAKISEKILSSACGLAPEVESPAWPLYLLPNQEVDLNWCRNPGQLETIPDAIRSQIGLGDKGSYQATFAVTGFTGTPENWSGDFRLVVKTGGKVFEVKGKLTDGFDVLGIGPGIWTKFFSVRQQKQIYTRVSALRIPRFKRGYVDLEGSKFGVDLTFSEGLSVHIFDHESTSWWQVGH